MANNVACFKEETQEIKRRPELLRKIQEEASQGAEMTKTAFLFAVKVPSIWITGL